MPWKRPRRSSVIALLTLFFAAVVTIVLVTSLSGSSPKNTAAERPSLPTISTTPKTTTTTSDPASSTSESPSSKAPGTADATASPATSQTALSTTVVPAPTIVKTIAVAAPPPPVPAIPQLYRGKLVISRYNGYDGWVDYIDSAGYRHWVERPAVRDCIQVHTGAPNPVTLDELNAYPKLDDPARCPYPSGMFISEAGRVMLIEGNMRRHASETCVQFTRPGDGDRFAVHNVPVDQSMGYYDGPDFGPSDQKCHGLPR